MTVEERLRQIQADLADPRERLRRAGEVYAAELRQVLGEAGDPRHPSRPGEAPHRVTGTLQNSVQARVEGDAALVGPTAPYAAKLARTRPFLQIAMDRCRDRVLAALLGR